MGQIQRYIPGLPMHSTSSLPRYTITKHEQGQLVLYADHLAAMSAKDEQIRQLREALQNARDAITLLPGGRSVMRRGIAEIDELLEATK